MHVLTNAEKLIPLRDAASLAESRRLAGMRMVTGTTSPSTRYERISVSPASCSIKSEYVIASHAFKPQYKCINYIPAWEQRKLGDVADIKTGPFGTLLHAEDYVDDGIPIVTTEHFKTGVLPKDKEGIPQVSEEDAKRLEQYRAKEGDILFSRVGSVDANAQVFAGQDGWLFSGRVLRARPDLTLVSSAYLHYELETEEVKSSVISRAVGGTMASINTEILFQTPIFIPAKMTEQNKIGSTCARLDSLITLHQRKYDKLVVFKKSMLEKMFPKDGESVPEIRFAGFTDPWEQRKLGELVVIERGGSPRPIDEYITDDTNGLNWVKIGDAPSLGRYISKTSEKIKPEGLSKTRQVHPGDLILSNSMSFGRPYIMAIEGCIHDGWLLIRDEPKSFDPMYLCHMLGTPKMLNQYRMLASGSTVNNLNKELVSNASILMPCKSEQKVIGQFFNHLDDLITLHQRKLELLRNIKKSLLDKMFV